MEDVITLSSDEENFEPPKKRIKPTKVEEKVNNDAVIISSDDDSNSGAENNHTKNKVKEIENRLEEDVLNLTEDSEVVEHVEVPEESNGNTLVSSIERSTFDLNEVSSSSSSDVETVEVSNAGIDEPEESKTSEPIDHEESSTSSESHNSLALQDLEAFLKVCKESITNSKYEVLKDRFPVITNLFKKYLHSNNYSDEINKLLKENTEKAKESAVEAVLGFNAIVEYINATVVFEDIEVKPEHRRKVKLLMKTMLKIIKRIKQLETAEVDWDDDSDSAYMQEDRYKQRLAKLFSCYCKYVKMNPHAGRLTHRKLDFVSSRFDEINVAVNKKFSYSKFPTYADMEKLLRQCVEDHGLLLSENAIKKESEMCFKALGELLQKRRKHELYESHYNFIRDGQDPASCDGQLDNILKRNFSEGMKKIEDICEKYVQKQNEGAEVHLSADSDDSNHIDSDDEKK